MVKNIRLLSFFIVMVFSSAEVVAKTLREMARTSNVLLVLSDRLGSDDSEIKKRSCGMSYKQISARSQKLKSQIDQKIDSLTPGDFRILEKRIGSCEQECTCDIYALAFEKKEKENEVLNQKAAQMTQQSREKCMSQIKNICRYTRF